MLTAWRCRNQGLTQTSFGLILK